MYFDALRLCNFYLQEFIFMDRVPCQLQSPPTKDTTSQTNDGCGWVCVCVWGGGGEGVCVWGRGV